MNKSAEAFRTIGEVADELGVPKHVLRFWEGRFPQIRPMKRGGGRRYYRPEDMELLRGIRALLHAEGYTIRGVQKILREHGVDQVKAAARRAPPAKAEAEAGGRKRGRKRLAAVTGNATHAVGARSQAAPESGAHFVLPPAPKARVLAALRELGVARAILLGQPIASESLAADTKKVRASGP